MNILVINCGSSSLKFQLINSESEEVLAKGLCERIGIDGSLTYQPAGGEKVKSDKAMPTHTEAIQFVIDALTDPETGVVKSLDEIGAVGHRVVHGGEKFASSVVITDEVKKAIEDGKRLKLGVRFRYCEYEWHQISLDSKLMNNEQDCTNFIEGVKTIIERKLYNICNE